MFELLPSLPLIFKPVVDNFTTDPFLPNDPWTSIESGDFNDVPIIIGAILGLNFLAPNFCTKIHIKNIDEIDTYKAKCIRDLNLTLMIILGSLFTTRELHF